MTGMSRGMARAFALDAEMAEALERGDDPPLTGPAEPDHGGRGAVERFDLEDVSRNPWHEYRQLVKNDTGDWVTYEDYAALEAKLAEIRRMCGDIYASPVPGFIPIADVFAILERA